MYVVFTCTVFDISQVISGYREAEKSSWHSEVSLSVVHRIREVTAAAVSLPSTSLLPLLHVLDLEMDGLVLTYQFC